MHRVNFPELDTLELRSRKKERKKGPGVLRGEEGFGTFGWKGGTEGNMAKSEVVGFAEADEEDGIEKWMILDDDDVLPSRIKRPPPVKRGRGKLILLEDILEKKKQRKMETKLKKGANETQDDDSGSSDDEEYSSGERDRDEVTNIHKVEKTLTDYSKHIAHGGSEAYVKWGEKVFGPQKLFPEFTVAISDTGLISRVLNFEPQEGTGRTDTAATMASSGLLLSWAVLMRRCDETTARWMFHQMAFSDSERVERGACKFLCDLLIRRSRDGRQSCELEWLPGFEDIKHTFHLCGYLDPCDEVDLQSAEPSENTGSADFPSGGEDSPMELTGSDERNGPPSNIRSLLQFLVPYFESRIFYNTLSTAEAESLVLLLFRCQLDRCMLNVSNLLRSCLDALIDSFTEEEWTSSCERIASGISRISSTFVNILRVAKSLHAMNTRFGSLQRLVVLELLSRRVEAKRNFNSPEDVVSIFKSVNIKESMYNFLNLYHLLILGDIYLWSDSSLTKKRKVFAVWLDFLKKCSTQISLQDPRPYSMKVRNWASFLSQKYQIEKMQTNSIAE